MADHSTASAAAAVASPLILDARDELLFFRTTAHLEAYVEVIDVVNCEYGPCWDAEGRLHELSVERRHSSVLGLLHYQRERVRVQAVEHLPGHLTDLHQALLRHVMVLGLEGEMPITNDTADILEFAIDHAGWS